MRSIIQTTVLLLALGLASIAPGCGNDEGSSSEPGSSTCVPNATNKCLCGVGKEGIQTCAADGKGYSACDCGSGGSAGAGGKGGSAGSAGSSAGGAGQGGSGGAAGTFPSSGSAGAAGSSAGQGGSAGSGGSQAGSAGAAGKASACVSDDDCKPSAPDSIPPACVVARCQDAHCVFSAPDLDGDKHPDASCKPVLSGDFAPGDDCDDSNPKIFPGAWDGPLGEGKPDSCDGKDNDCSGTPDDLTLSDGSSCSCTVGQTRDCSYDANGTKLEFPGGSPAAGSTCKLGTQACVKGSKGGEWETKCTGAVGPKDKDSCNGLDEDCDGTADSAPCACTVGTSGNCETGLSGKCKGGTRQCGADGQWGECKPTIAPQKDTCELGNDDDCDGKPNNSSSCECLHGSPPQSCGVSSTPPCKNGQKTCNATGQWDPCIGNVDPQPEACDGVDNDCNGLIDDGVKTTYYVDADGDAYCEPGTTQACSQPAGYVANCAGNDECPNTKAYSKACAFGSNDSGTCTEAYAASGEVGWGKTDPDGYYAGNVGGEVSYQTGYGWDVYLFGYGSGSGSTCIYDGTTAAYVTCEDDSSLTILKASQFSKDGYGDPIVMIHCPTDVIKVHKGSTAAASCCTGCLRHVTAHFYRYQPACGYLPESLERPAPTRPWPRVRAPRPRGLLPCAP